VPRSLLALSLINHVTTSRRKTARTREYQKSMEKHRAQLQEAQAKIAGTTSNLSTWGQEILGRGGSK
jgi:Tfp pilus assembly protein PilX